MYNLLDSLAPECPREAIIAHQRVPQLTALQPSVPAHQDDMQVTNCVEAGVRLILKRRLRSYLVFHSQWC